MEIEKIGPVSTGNVKQSDCELLKKFKDNERRYNPLIAYEKGEYGWFVYIPVGDTNEEMQAKVAEMRKAGYSDALIILVEHFWQEKINWLMLDRDADHLEGFERFEW